MPTINRTQLVNDFRTILAGKIGSYSFPQPVGAPLVQDAIALLPVAQYGFNYPPEKVTITGIEVVINDATIEYNTRFNQHTAAFGTWKVYVKQWDTEQVLSDVLDELTFELGQLGYRLTNFIEQEAEEGLGLIRTIRFDIRDDYSLVDAIN